MVKTNNRTIRCIECGCFTRTIGRVPPVTVECRTCGEVFRLTSENLIKMKRTVDRERVSQSKDHYPRHIKPSRAKIRGER